MLNRRWTSLLDGPQSSAMLPVAGMANAPSVSFFALANDTLVKTLIRRQFQRLFAAAAPPAPGGGGGGPPAPTKIIIRSPPFIIIGPGEATLKLTLAPTLRLLMRERASPSTSTTLTNSGSGRTPPTGALRLNPRIRFWPRVCA